MEPLTGIPHQGFARGTKVGREEIAGLIVALEKFAAGSDEADVHEWTGILDQIEFAISRIPHITISRTTRADRKSLLPLLKVHLHASPPGTGYEVVNALLQRRTENRVGRILGRAQHSRRQSEPDDRT